MAFKENLLKKIRIKRLGQTILSSMGPVDGGRRTDIAAARELLDLSPYAHHKERDLDLYLQKTDEEKYRIIVLGNDLPMYVTTVADVAMRRSPTVKEMISIRNAFRILNDTDVLVQKGPETVETVLKECMDPLDLSYEKADLVVMAEEGVASLADADEDGVIESLSLFAELLGFERPPKELEGAHQYLMGLSVEKGKEGRFFGPMILYRKMHNDLRYIDESVPISNRNKMEWVRRVATGLEPAPLEGAEVFTALLQSVPECRSRSGS